MPPETIVLRGRHGLPYSKGLMAQSLSASGLAPERAFDLARMVERRLIDSDVREIDTAGLRELCEEVLSSQEGEGAVRRFRNWQQLDRLERPLVVLLGGTTGVGKSTVATMLAARLGITRVIPTDVIRQVLRAFFSHEFMPSVHYSAFEAGRALESGKATNRVVAGYLEQSARVGTGVAAIVERAAGEAEPLIVEGVHVLPGALAGEPAAPEPPGNGSLSERCVLVEALLTVDDQERHRSHFLHRGGSRPAERYLRSFAEIRSLQGELVRLAKDAGVAVIDNGSVDKTLARLMGLVLDAVSEAR